MVKFRPPPQRAMPRATCIRTVDGFSASFYNAAFEEATRRVAVSQRIRRYEKIGFRSLTVAALFPVPRVCRHLQSRDRERLPAIENVIS